MVSFCQEIFFLAIFAFRVTAAYSPRNGGSATVSVQGESHSLFQELRPGKKCGRLTQAVPWPSSYRSEDDWAARSNHF